MATNLIDMTLWQKLACIQQELIVGKPNHNSHHNYPYFKVQDIFAPLKPLLNKYGCSLVITEDLTIMQNNRYIKATAMLVDTVTEKTISADGWAREADVGNDAPKLTGTASTYAKKRALNNLLMIEDGRDPDDDIICDHCHKPVTDYQAKNGTKTVETLVEYSRKDFGKVLCGRCLAAAYNERDAQNGGQNDG